MVSIDDYAILTPSGKIIYQLRRKSFSRIFFHTHYIISFQVFKCMEIDILIVVIRFNVTFHLYYYILGFVGQIV